MKRNKLRHLLVAAAVLSSLVVVACGDDDEDSTASSGGGGGADTAAADSGSGGGDPATAWCGDKKITLGIQDGGGLNGWSKESTKQVKLEAAKCKNIEKVIEVNAGFDVQKAISGFNGLVAQGANAIVIIPDAGGPGAELPGIRRATQRGVKVVAWGADPTGTEGTDFEAYVDWDPVAAGKTWAEWLAGVLGDKGNVIFLGGPPGNAVDAGTLKGALEVFEGKPGMKMLTGDKPAVANWDPAETQKVTAGLITKNPQIDGIIVADGQSGAGAIRAFQAAGKKVPPIATLEANEISCIWEEAQGKDDEFALGTISARNWMGRYAVRKAVAAANETEDPAKKIVSLPIYEDSEGEKAPQCKPSDPPDSFFSNQEPDDYFAGLMGS
jgi:ribose transport system substrate-binding protein